MYPLTRSESDFVTLNFGNYELQSYFREHPLEGFSVNSPWCPFCMQGFAYASECQSAGDFR
jgi:hypothetical protein